MDLRIISLLSSAVEQLIRNEQVVSSILTGGSEKKALEQTLEGFLLLGRTLEVHHRNKVTWPSFRLTAPSVSLYLIR